MPNEPVPADQKRPRPQRHEHDQGDHEGSPHSPDEFDVMNPAKQVRQGNKKTPKGKQRDDKR